MAQLGALVQDIVTGAKGIVVARAEYLFDAVSVQIAPKTEKDGVPAAAYWLAANRVRVLEATGLEMPPPPRIGFVPAPR